MNRSLLFGGVGVLALAIVVGVFLVFRTPEPSTPGAEPTASTVPIGAQEPAAPATPSQPEPPMRPDFDVVRVDKDGNVVIAGRATPGCTIIVRDGDTEVGRSTVDRSGEWVLVPDGALSPGTRELTLLAECDGAEPMTADRVVALVVPERSGGNALALAVPTETNTGETEVLQRPGAPAAVDKIDYNEAGETSLSGVAAPNATVRIYLDNELVGTTRADGDGNWSLTLKREIPSGKYTLRLDQVHPDGTVIARSELPFVRAEPPAETEDGRVVIIQPGDHLWGIARKRYGSGFRFTLIYEANKDQIRDPDLIYPGQVFTVPTQN